MIVYLAGDIQAFVMYCVNGTSRSSLLKPGLQYDAGASVASQTSRASSAKTSVPVHNLAPVAS